VTISFSSESKQQFGRYISSETKIVMNGIIIQFMYRTVVAFSPMSCAQCGLHISHHYAPTVSSVFYGQ